jgi:hypothetical protein
MNGTGKEPGWKSAYSKGSQSLLSYCSRLAGSERVSWAQLEPLEDGCGFLLIVGILIWMVNSGQSTVC